MSILLAVLLGFILDVIIGDPHGIWHPICFIGNMVSFGEKRIRSMLPKSQPAEYWGGVMLWFFVAVLSFVIPAALLFAAWKINFYVYFILQIVFCYQIFAAKSLKTESMRVYYALESQNLQEARKYVSWIVGRDTENLSSEQVTKAAVETVAENTTDGVIAPMIFMLIGGAPLGFLYKAVNTMDSMLGYKNEKYLYFGRFAAKIDDGFNFIPARLSGIFMIIASAFAGFNAKNAAKIFFRDRKNHASPNSAHTESACAGALEIQLAGNAYYFGKLYEKPTIGDAIRPIQPYDIVKSNRLMYASAVIALIMCGFIRFILFF